MIEDSGCADKNIDHGMLTLAVIGLAAISGSGPLPVYVCPKVARPPAVDGRLDDDAWKTAPAAELVDSVTGGKCSKATAARMCWDDERLYISFDCVDPDIWGTMTQRDDLIFREEVVEAFLDPNCSLHRYFEFNVSPRNVLFDAYVVNPDGLNPGEGTEFGWNCEGAVSAVCVDGTVDNRSDVDRGWTAELAIPFKSLGRSTPKPGERWRGNLFRIDLSPLPKEFQAWSPPLFDPPRFHVPKRFGTIFFSDGG